MDVRKLGVYSLAHMLVDFGCAFLLFRSLRGTEHFAVYALLYNFCAFAMQMPFGILADVWNHNSLTAAFGCILIAFAYIVPAPVIAVVAAGMGNALFHLGGGIDTMNASAKKASALGIFVSPGALGLYVGTLLGKQEISAFPLWAAPVLLLLIGALILAVCHASDQGLVTANVSFDTNMPVKPFWILPFFLVVVLRSYMGMNQQFPWKSEEHWGFVLVLALVLGKMAGGVLMDHLGARKTVISTLLLSAFFYLFSSFLPIAGVLAVFLFNMTMPITLMFMGRMLPGAKGFAFGILTFGLFLGYVPSAFGVLTLPGYGWAYTVIAVLSLVLMLRPMKEIPC